MNVTSTARIPPRRVAEDSRSPATPGRRQRSNTPVTPTELETNRTERRPIDTWYVAGGSEAELRREAAELMATNWPLVELIATELLEHETLDGSELVILHEFHQGNASRDDLESYRRLRLVSEGMAEKGRTRR
jgi:hypothetical protein